MNQGIKKTLIIGFFILIWLGIIFYEYIEIKSLKDKNREFSLETSLIKNNFAGENQATFPVKKSHNNFFDQSADNDGLVLEHTAVLEQENVIQNQPSDVTYEKKGIVDVADEKPEESQKIEREMCGDFPCFSDTDFVELYNSFESESGLMVLDKYIYNNKQADDRIRNIAEERGYKKRVSADESTLVWQSGKRTQPKLRENYIKMKKELEKQNISIHLVSGYRSSTHQRKIFKNKMGKIDITKITSGFYDKKINSVLEISSIPGYSRHHSGYTVDLGCGNDYLVYSFATTPCYEWLSNDNFENAKRFGFIPSYPENVDKQGPNPEPWEYVWVGQDYIKNYFNNLDKEKNENF